MNLQQYVYNYTERNTCRCGKCFISGANKPMVGHTVDMFFFDVCAKNEPDVNIFKKLIKEHQGEWSECNPLDDEEHGYIEIGGWIGDQGLALQFMALGKILGLWGIMQPTMIGLQRDDPTAKLMAGMGMVSIVRKGKS
jgi:hypothetical protein